MKSDNFAVDRPQRYLVFGDFTGQLAIGRGLAALSLPVTIVNSCDFGIITPGDWLFFTEESSMEANADRPDVQFLPRDVPFPVDDKVAFARYLQSVEVDLPVPFAEIGPELSSPFGYPVVVKGRSSWCMSRRVPRGAVCHTFDELERWLAKAAREGWKTKDFFLQKFLPDGITNVVSACGFFDWQRPERNAVILCRKLLARGSGFETSAAAVAVVADPSNLYARTQSLMTTLRYTGPFELEFIHDESGIPRVLELNARFWMQHGLFVRFFENALIRRYLGHDTESDWQKFRLALTNPAPILWINSFGLLGSLYKRRWGMIRDYVILLLRYFRSGRIMLDPPLMSTAASFARNIVFHRKPFPIHHA